MAHEVGRDDTALEAGLLALPVMRMVYPASHPILAYRLFLLVRPPSATRFTLPACDLTNWHLFATSFCLLTRHVMPGSSGLQSWQSRAE